MKLSWIIEQLNAELEKLGDVEIMISSDMCVGYGKDFDLYVYDPVPSKVRSDDTTLPYELSFEENYHAKTNDYDKKETESVHRP